ncbi:MAG: regulatory iron-sulfur-containing complex subunit RicT [Planctomycetota bacterium]|nr:regulatory iron-sulfur-containing complex subunit RicT [Planctomycetota bacterium]
MTSSQFVVRYGATRFIGEFSTRNPEDLPRNSPVIIRSERGVEWGIVLSPASDRTREYLGRKSTDGKIVRPATAEDRSLLEQTRQKERDEFDGCAEMIRDRRLNMQLVDVEHLFGGERVVFYYLAEDRVDFRELVKELAKRFKTRIEMRQIGVRDEAKLLADYGDCGKPVCCNTHLHEMPPVSMKMAKLQKATLDPTKISGRCGRLKCCLRYEYDTYRDFQKELPPVGATVVTKNGQGQVLAQEILSRKLLVRFEGNRQLITDLADIVTVIKAGQKR